MESSPMPILTRLSSIHFRASSIVKVIVLDVDGNHIIQSMDNGSKSRTSTTRNGDDFGTSSTMSESTETISGPSSPNKSERSLDSAPLELTVTTSISSLSPDSPATTTTITSQECTIMDVAAIEETSSIIEEETETATATASICSSISPKSESENNHALAGDLVERHHHNNERRLVDLKPMELSNYPKFNNNYQSSPSSAAPSRLGSPNSQQQLITISDVEIRTGARYLAFDDFERVFETWKAKNYHPFRVASSETLRLPDGSTNSVFKYRYIVFHCAHYGQPRCRGVGKRPNQNYMPCGCKAMLRLNYSWSENALRITTLNDEHAGHDANEDAYYKFAAKAKQRQGSSSPPSSIISAVKRQRSESPYSTASTTNGVSPRLHPPPSKMAKNGSIIKDEAPLNLSKNGMTTTSNNNNNGFVNGFNSSKINNGDVPSAPNVIVTPIHQPPPPAALSVLMFNQQQQHVHHQQQQAYNELVRLLSVNGNVNHGMVTRAECRTDADRHRLIYPIMQAMTQHLAVARGFDLDEKLHDLKAVLKKWQLLQPPVIQAPPQPPMASSAAAAAAMMVQAMSGTTGGLPSINGLIANGHHR